MSVGVGRGKWSGPRTRQTRVPSQAPGPRPDALRASACREQESLCAWFPVCYTHTLCLKATTTLQGWGWSLTLVPPLNLLLTVSFFDLESVPKIQEPHCPWLLETDSLATSSQS